MNIATKEIELDVFKPNTSITVSAKQGDMNSRFLKCILKNDDQRLLVDKDLYVVVNAKRLNSNKTALLTCDVNDDGTVNIPIDDLASELGGTIRCDISIMNLAADTKLSAMSFIIETEAAVVSNEEISKNSKTDILNNLIKTCNKALEQAEQVDISAVQTATGADITVTNREGVNTTVHIDTLFAVESWNDIRNAVRLGIAEKLFPVGYEFTVPNSYYNYDMVFRVVGHNHHKAANTNLKHTMTLEMKNVLSNSSGTDITVQYDAPEALYYAERGLESGTYNFTWNYDTGSVVSGTYQFTLAQDIPVGGQIVIGTNTNSSALTACEISTYASAGDTKTIESGVIITNGSSGTCLGTVSVTSATDEKLNCGQRILFGSNNYDQSAVDQWLNSFAAIGSVWTPKTVFDRPPSWANAYNGYMYGLPEDFLAAVQPAIIPCRTNSIYETDSLDGTKFAVNQTYELKRKFFLLSRPEIFGSWDSTSIKDGEVLEYYDGLTDSERIHRDTGGSARDAWLRSPYPENASSARFVLTGGAASYYSARTTFGIIAACIIA